MKLKVGKGEAYLNVRRLFKKTAYYSYLPYPDGDQQVNNFQRERAPLDELVTWVV